MVFVLLLLFLVFPSLCQLHGLIIGGYTFLSAFQLIFSGNFCAERTINFEPVFPFYLGDLLNNFSLAWGLLFASRKTGSTIISISSLLCLLNTFLGVSGLIYFHSFSSVHLPSCWAGIIFVITRVVIGIVIVQTILAAWTTSAPSKK